MIRGIIGLVFLAVLAWTVVHVAFQALGTLIGLTIATLVFAAFGYLIYLVLTVFSPNPGEKVRDLNRGRRANNAKRLAG